MNMKTVCLVLLMLWTSAVAAVTPSKAKFDVQNMTCAACGITIEKALGRVAGVSSTKVDAETNTVTVEFDAKRTTPSALAEVITNAGFPAKPSPVGG